MAFPAVQTADTKNGTQTSNSTTFTLTYPTNLAAGDLILACYACDGNPGAAGTWPADWVTRSGSAAGGAAFLCWAKKIALGSETGNFTVTLAGGASEQGGWRVFRITGWGGTIGSNFQNLDATSGDVVAVASVVAATSANPNPPSLDPVNWATEDTLWLAICGIDTSRTISVYPLADLNTADVSGGAGGATLGVCMANSAVSSLDPGTFTISASDDWAANTIAVRPAAEVAPPPRYGNVNFQDPGVFSVPVRLYRKARKVGRVHLPDLWLPDPRPAPAIP